MTLATTAIALFFVCVVTLAATRVYIGYARRRQILDIPSHRSSHTVPTPRGGGVAIASVVLLALVVMDVLGILTAAQTAAMAGGGALVAFVGWMDDRGDVSVRSRSAVHVVAAIFAVRLLGGFSSIDLGLISIPLGPLGPVLAVLFIVWMTNLYNFMDGIDGIAAGEAAVVGGAASLVLASAGAAGLAAIAALTSAACLGFLVWNWQPAKIFMGDTSSGLLGFLFGALAVGSENAHAVPIVSWVMMLGVFTFDATVTLVRRVRHGERWYEAHRSHAYQRMTQSGWSHARTTSAALLTTLVLAGLAWYAQQAPRRLPAALVAGSVILCVLYVLVERRAPFRGNH
ncbi:MAG TPA: glycosyltransferase family 4 protein [Gemmatimonadaceae bacterium]|nr:glycosyltransferase family 4 protein [Gemmatimonadaceae bacterium]